MSQKKPSTVDYGKIYKLYKIVCNNSVNAGDCYGTTYCLCQCTDRELKEYYNKQRKDVKIIHKQYWCSTCRIMVCECCYDKCPGCTSTN